MRTIYIEMVARNLSVYDNDDDWFKWNPNDDEDDVKDSWSSRMDGERDAQTDQYDYSNSDFSYILGYSEEKDRIEKEERKRLEEERKRYYDYDDDYDDIGQTYVENNYLNTGSS